VLDLYAGVGLFTAFLADRAGTDRVVAVEGHPGAARDAVANLPHEVRVLTGDVGRVLRERLDEPFDLVVLDPPREGARRAVVEQVVDRAPRAAAYVACDPAALARDVAVFAEHGYALTDLRAFDLFPMTHHVECVALLEKTGSDLR
jgi:tRNA/tmRNA/rRNA uracil-C5-methylase (TrmA/RlmC/RlmD family)